MTKIMLTEDENERIFRINFDKTFESNKNHYEKLYEANKSASYRFMNKINDPDDYNKDQDNQVHTNKDDLVIETCIELLTKQLRIKDERSIIFRNHIHFLTKSQKKYLPAVAKYIVQKLNQTG